MPVTSVNIDSDALREAKQAFGVRTNREAINLALRETVMRQRQLAAIHEIVAVAVDEDAEKIKYAR